MQNGRLDKPTAGTPEKREGRPVTAKGESPAMLPEDNTSGEPEVGKKSLTLPVQ